MRYFLHFLLPKKLLSALMYKLSRIENKTFKNIAIKAFMKITGANLDDSQRETVEEYKSLLDFFTRELEDNARQITGENIIASPVDGRIAHFGDIEGNQIFQIKGHSYSVDKLITENLAQKYQNGQAITIYLAPYDYHRIHMPADGKLINATYIPGELNSVSIALLDRISGLFARNERLVLEFEGVDNNEFIMVLVGAVNVGSIETVVHGEISPNNYKEQFSLPTNSEEFKKGDEIGRFNLGSTVILISKKGTYNWNNLEFKQKLEMGEAITQKSSKTNNQ